MDNENKEKSMFEQFKDAIRFLESQCKEGETPKLEIYICGKRMLFEPVTGFEIIIDRGNKTLQIKGGRR